MLDKQVPPVATKSRFGLPCVSTATVPVVAVPNAVKVNVAVNVPLVEPTATVGVVSPATSAITVCVSVAEVDPMKDVVVT